MEDTWVDVCALDQLLPGRGVAALVHGEQVALFRVGADDVLAISNYDPFSGAFVLSRGLVGSVGDEITVASPVYKQRFALVTGKCVDDPNVVVATYPVRIRVDRVEVSTPA
jgi:nitrite reductase (NADH) small subunit